MRGSLGLVVWIAVATLGCDTPQAARDEQACTTLCGCFVPFESQQEACVTDCVGELGPVSEDCASCVNLYANACADLADQCEDACSSAQPLQLVTTGGS